jgi:hypothetical protein
MTKMLGANLAKQFGDAHEISEPGPRDERLMDLFNNNVGRRLAVDPRNKGRNDEQVVLDALNRGELQISPVTIAPGTVVPQARNPANSSPSGGFGLP